MIPKFTSLAFRRIFGSTSSKSTLKTLLAKIEMPDGQGGTYIKEQEMHLDWKNAVQIRFGLDFQVRPNFFWRGGVYHDLPRPPPTIASLDEWSRGRPLSGAARGYGSAAVCFVHLPALLWWCASEAAPPFNVVASFIGVSSTRATGRAANRMQRATLRQRRCHRIGDWTRGR